MRICGLSLLVIANTAAKCSVGLQCAQATLLVLEGPWRVALWADPANSNFPVLKAWKYETHTLDLPFLLLVLEAFFAAIENVCFLNKHPTA